MIRFKLKQGMNPPYEITRNNFEKFTLNAYPYNQVGKDHKLRNFAVCPACDNPIQLIGLYKKSKNTDRPYGKHYVKGIPGLANYNRTAFLFCPYSDKFHKITKENRNEEITEREVEIYNAVRDYFDLAVYVIRQETGIYLGKAFLKKMLSDFLAARGYMYPWASLYNIPWMLMYFTRSSSLYGCLVKKDSKMFEYLQTRKDVELTPSEWKAGHYRIGNVGKFLNLNFSTILHDRKKTASNEELKETIVMSIHSITKNVPPKEYHQIHLEINEYRFPRLIQAAKYRDKELLKMAVEMMPELKTASCYI